MDILITGDRQEFCPTSFQRRLYSGLSKLNIPLSDVRNVVRTAYGGAELRAEQFAHDIGLGVVRVPIPEKLGKHARNVAINTAIRAVDAIVILASSNGDAYCQHTIRRAERSGKPMVVC